MVALTKWSVITLSSLDCIWRKPRVLKLFSIATLWNHFKNFLNLMPAVRRPAFFDFFPSVFLLNDLFSRFISRWRLNLFGFKHSLFNCLNKLHISLISGLNINRYLLLHFLMFSCLLGFIDWAAPDALLLFCVVSLVEPINKWVRVRLGLG